MSHVKTFLGKHKKLCIFLVILIAAVLAGRAYLNSAQNNTEAAPVQTFSLTRRDMDSTLSASGTITSKNICKVTSTLTYPIAELRVKTGDTVQQGDVLAVLDTSSLNSDISALQKQQGDSAVKAQLAVDQAARHLQDARNQKTFDQEHNEDLTDDAMDSLLRNDSIAIENAQDNLNEAILGQKSLSSTELQKLLDQRKECTITAPQSGVVTALSSVGAAGDIATLEDPNDLVLEVNIKEYDINRIQQGQKVTITSGAQDTFTGYISWIAPRAVQNSSGDYLFPIHVTVEGDLSLLHLGMSARARIILESAENVFVVPLDALGTDADGNALIYAKQPDGSFLPIVVQTGLENDFEVEISGEGLTEGMELQSLASDAQTAATANAEA